MCHLICLISCHNYYLKRLGILTIQFYQLLLLYNIAFTLLATFILVMEAGHLDAAVFLFGKVIGFFAAIGLQYYSSKQTYFYFRNAGCNITTLFINAFIIDALIYAILILLPSLIHYVTTYING